MHEFLVKNDPATFEAFDQFLMNSSTAAMACRQDTRKCACLHLRRCRVQPAGDRESLSQGAGCRAAKEHLIQALEITAAVMATRTLASGINAVMAAEAK